MFRRTSAVLAAALLTICFAAPLARSAEPDTMTVSDPARFGILVSATKTPKSAIEVPNGAAIVTGAQLRQSGARTLADALIDVVGVEAGGGTDNGANLTNIGMWGLKEFDALLVTVDGVPVGGPFNPELSHIDVGDIDHIEVVKGPQGTMYGLAAFAGMVQVFTNSSAPGTRNLTIGGGSFANANGSANLSRQLNENWRGDLHLSGRTGDGWQDRTGSNVFSGRATLTGHLGNARLALDLSALSDHSDWGTPMPVGDSEPIPFFGVHGREANFAVGGATVNHDVFGLGLRSTMPVTTRVRFENVFNFTHDGQKLIRNFFAGDDASDPAAAPFAGLEIAPKQSTVFDDARMIHDFEAAGRHQLVAGAALTWGELKASGVGKDFTVDVTKGGAGIPDWGSIAATDHPEFEDGRLFVGVYAHDEWTPQSHVTIGGGGRFDNAHEELETDVNNGGTEEKVKNTKNSSAWSGDLSALVRLMPAGSPHAVNLYGSWKSSFKPAAPNLTEAESADILDPERTHSLEGGVKGSFFSGQLAFDAALFQLDFHNMVVSIDNGGTPQLVNAGHERFKGTEVSGRVSPAALPGFSLAAGWANHDPRFVDFIFNGSQLGGNLIEVAPRQMWNARASYAPVQWASVWVAGRHEGNRPMKRRKQYLAERWTPPFSEYDAGLTLKHDRAQLVVAGRNLGDDVHYVSESDIGDSQFYYAPPKRFTAELSFSF